MPGKPINIAFFSELNDLDTWKPLLVSENPNLRFYPLLEVEAANEMDFALVWNPPRGALSRFRNLTAILNMGAGTDALLLDNSLNKDIPIVRLVDPHLTQRMIEYTLLHVLKYHRQSAMFDDFQRAKRWEEVQTPVAQQRVVGVMGMGAIGKECALALKRVGFDVRGWSRTKKSIDGVSSFSGSNDISTFVRDVDILVSILPLTNKTAGLLCDSLFNQMKNGVYLINIGRGKVHVEADILRALDNEKLAGVTLDVFEHEPLPKDSRLWAHPKVTVTPHVASITDPTSAAKQISYNIDKLLAGEVPVHVVDVSRGY